MVPSPHASCHLQFTSQLLPPNITFTPWIHIQIIIISIHSGSLSHFVQHIHCSFVSLFSSSSASTDEALLSLFLLDFSCKTRTLNLYSVEERFIFGLIDAMTECYSPELRSMDKDSLGAYTSPGTPDYEDNHGKGFQKGWCSERVPLPSSNSNLRRTSVNVLMPLNNGRTLPSKWDDAERWITSPVSGSGVCKTFAPAPQRQPKSKSGPLVPAPRDTYFSSYSPGFPLVEGGSTNDIFAGSPLATGVLVPSGYSFGGIDAQCVPADTEYRGAPSELFLESSYPDSQDEKIDGNNVTCAISRRDLATQMSPVDSPESSPKGRVLLSTSPLPVEPNSHRSTRVEVRDVQVDKSATMPKQLKRDKTRMEKNGSTEIEDLALTWNTTAGAMELSKLQEEARITAWENLQNAKADASIRKLEMKLEKKKSASMEKIMKKLRIAQTKAQEMRKRILANEAPRTTLKVVSLHRFPKISLTPCFSSKHP